MIKKHRICRLFILFIAAASLLSSCIPQQRIKYVQDKTVADSIKNVYATPPATPLTIQPYDELYIKVLSLDEKMHSFFNLDATKTSNLSTSLISYTVNDSGAIDFPFVGKIYLEGLTIDEAKIQVQNAISQYIDAATVIIKLVEKDITILGEVRKPGKYTFTKEQISILQALGMAGDVTDFANRNKITLIRGKNDKTTFHYIDITDRTVVESPFYYLKPNDVVYVEPLPAKFWGVKASPPETLMTYITYLTTLMSVFVFVKSLK